MKDKWLIDRKGLWDTVIGYYIKWYKFDLGSLYQTVHGILCYWIPSAYEKNASCYIKSSEC